MAKKRRSKRPRFKGEKPAPIAKPAVDDTDDDGAADDARDGAAATPSAVADKSAATSADKSAADKFAADKSATDNAADKAAGKSAADKSAADESAADESAADKSAADKSAANKSAADTSAADKSAADKSAAGKSAADKGAADRSAGKSASGKRSAKRPPKAKAKLPQVIVRAERLKQPEAPARDPVFWFGFEVTWAKLAAARFIMFAMLALDALMQLPHAPRYGAGDFNVPQLPFLDVIAPGRVAFGTGQLLLAYGFILVAFGVASRVIVPVCAAIYAWLYFGSQLDSYQHHYLVALVLVIASFVPWQRPSEDAEPSTPVRSWAARLLLVQLAILYVWAAVSKMDQAWVDGTTLSMQMKGGIGSFITETIGFKVASVAVILVELVLAATVWARPAWRIAAPLGLLFHIGIVFTGLEIGLFAFLMIGIYALVIPDSVWIAIASGPFERIGRILRRPNAMAWIVGSVVAVGLAWLVRFEGAFLVAAALSAVPLAIAVYGIVRKRPAALAVGVAHALAVGLWLVIDRTTDVTVDYYRFWGGSQRRIGSPEVAEHAYRRLTEVDPERESGHYQLGRLLIKRGATEEGLVHLREAQRLEPSIARSFVEEARLLQQQGKHAEAVEKAKQATYADPSHAEARALLDSLTANKPAPAAAPPSDDDPE